MQDIALEAVKLLSIGLYSQLVPIIRDARLNWVHLLEAVFPYCILLTIYVMSEKLLYVEMPVADRYRIFAFIMLTGLLSHVMIAGTALGILYREKDALNRQIQTNMKRQYDLLQNSQEHEDQIRKMNHDLKNTLLVIRQMKDQLETVRFIDRYLGDCSPL